ncbi:chitobiase/beta-hexosaminidase C-terminal domain-containing protein [candidate division KSB1 bacterium]|nr:chitobiase/beta-hexosaminidase C-terminal domain-containing protein [candidate division KSB1 bacterium]
MNTTRKIFFTTFILFSLCCLLYALDTESVTLQFDPERGFFKDNFELTLSTTPSGLTIKYTKDGTDPFVSSTAIQGISPVTVQIDPANTEGRDRAPGFCVRAVAIQADTAATKVQTHTYIFIERVVELSPDGQRPGAGWLQENSGRRSKNINYGMDRQVTNHPLYRDKIVPALLDIPTFSMVMDLKDLFDPQRGIYTNALEHGIEWERPCSIELVYPDGTPGFQINCGVRIRGGWSRNNSNPKHAFRWFFRKTYGPGKLRYPLFGDEGVDEFDCVDLRTSQNYSWSYGAEDPSKNTMNRDVFSRDMQRDMNEPYTRSRYNHLYINGTYWGLYQTQERPEASFGASYLGGDPDDYDVIKVDGGYQGPFVIEVTDGTMDAWRELWEASMAGFETAQAYYKVQGKNPDGTRNPEYKVLLNVDNLIDFMLTVFVSGDCDAPVSNFIRNNTAPNNFYSIYNRNIDMGFIHIRHDAEHTLGAQAWGDDRTGSFPAGSTFETSNPQWLHQQLCENPLYVSRFADRVYKHFFNGGALTPQVNINRFLTRKQEIDLAIIAESARWGDSKREPAFTRDGAWLTEINRIVEQFLPDRTDVVLAQLKSKAWYPQIYPPVFNTESRRVPQGFELVISATGGQIYYTTDGSDPYQPGNASTINSGEISETALQYTKPIVINETTRIKARVLDNINWSAQNEVMLYILEGVQNLRITEIHYHPLDDNISDVDREYEFLELKNIGDEALNLKGLEFSRGISYSFPEETQLDSGQFIVLASNKNAFFNRYGFYPFDVYEGQLDNSGETIALNTAAGDTIINIRYNDEYPWPNSADGDGYSIVTREEDPFKNQNDAVNWLSSGDIHGSPGVDDLNSSVHNSGNEVVVIHDYQLFQNYPNPFNDKTTIQFRVPKKSFVTIKIYNILGREVDELVSRNYEPGDYSVRWNGSLFASGLYFYRLTGSDGISVTRKLVFIR